MKKIIALLIIVMSLLAVFTACGSSSDLKLLGKKITFPCSLSDLGLSLDLTYNYDIHPDEIGLYYTNEMHEVDVIVKNTTQNPISPKDATVIGLYFTGSVNFDYKGINMESTREDVVKVFGEPKEGNFSDEYTYEKYGYYFIIGFDDDDTLGWFCISQEYYY